MDGWAEVDAPAKVNLWLRVLEPLASGYHALDSLFCAVSLCDTVRVRRAGRGIALRVAGGGELGPPERNLAVRAAAAFCEAVDEPPALELELVKRIPVAAGLGGGSSDAAATLRALNYLHGDPLRPPELLRVGAALGSDVSFFLAGSPLALGWGRGEQLLALPPLPSRPVLIAHPGEAMPTADAFARLRAARRGDAEARLAARARSVPLEALREWRGVAAFAENDFEAFAVERIPRLRTARDATIEAGAAVALLAGSGASYFGVFEDESARDAAGARLREAAFEVWHAATLQALPDPRPAAAAG